MYIYIIWKSGHLSAAVRARAFFKGSCCTDCELERSKLKYHLWRDFLM